MFKSYTKNDWVSIGMGSLGIWILVVFLNVKLLGKSEEQVENKEVDRKASVASSMKVMPKTTEEELDKRELYKEERIALANAEKDNKGFEDEDFVGDFKDDLESKKKRSVDQELIDKILNEEHSSASGFITEAEAPDPPKAVSNESGSSKGKENYKNPKVIERPVVDRVVVTAEPIKERKRGFNTLRRTEVVSVNKNSVEVKAVVHGDQVVTDGSSIKLRLKEKLDINGITVSRNTIVYGVIDFSQDRAMIDISSMRIGDQIIPTEIKVYGLDGMEGILINDFAGSADTKSGVFDEALNEMGQQIGNKTGTRAIFRGAQQENRTEKVTVVGDTKLILK